MRRKKAGRSAEDRPGSETGCVQIVHRLAGLPTVQCRE